MTSKVIEGHKSSSNFSVNPTLPLMDGPLMLPSQIVCIPLFFLTLYLPLLLYAIINLPLLSYRTLQPQMSVCCVWRFGVSFTYVIETIDSKLISVCLINDYLLIADLHIFVYGRAECATISLEWTKVKLLILNYFAYTYFVWKLITLKWNKQELQLFLIPRIPRIDTNLSENSSNLSY
jgi:hypothetical protein